MNYECYKKLLLVAIMVAAVAASTLANKMAVAAAMLMDIQC